MASGLCLPAPSGRSLLWPGEFSGHPVGRPCFLYRPGLGGVEIPPQLPADGVIQFTPSHPARLPYRVDQRVQVLSGLFELGRRNAAERRRPVPGLVVASHEIAACVAAPERQVSEVGAVGVDLATVRQACIDISATSTAMDPSDFSLNRHRSAT